MPLNNRPKPSGCAASLGQQIPGRFLILEDNSLSICRATKSFFMCWSQILKWAKRSDGWTSCPLVPNCAHTSSCRRKVREQRNTFRGQSENIYHSLFSIEHITILQRLSESANLWQQSQIHFLVIVAGSHVVNSIVISKNLCVHVSVRQDESTCVFLPGSTGISRICSRSSNICCGTRVVHVVPRCLAFTGIFFDLSCLSSSLSPIETFLVQTWQQKQSGRMFSVRWITVCSSRKPVLTSSYSSGREAAEELKHPETLLHSQTSQKQGQAGFLQVKYGAPDKRPTLMWMRCSPSASSDTFLICCSFSLHSSIW